MKLTESSAPNDVAELFILTSRSEAPWDCDENPGDLRHNSPCPKCGAPVTNRRVGMGAPKFLGCNNYHAYLLPGVEDMLGDLPEVEDELDDLGEHTCRFPPSGLEDEGKIRKGAQAGCATCAFMWDTILDAGFNEDDPYPSGGTGSSDHSEDDDSLSSMLDQFGIGVEDLATMTGKERAALLRRMILAGDKRRHHKAGEFGTGRPAKMSPEDSLNVLYLKMKQQEGMKGVGETGRTPERYRDRCTYGHTCGFYPNGEPAANYPLPDPQATSGGRQDPLGQGRYAGREFIRAHGLTPGRFNNWFREAPSNTRLWPVSGLRGFAPKEEFEFYIDRKMSCDLCVTRELGEARAEEVLGHPPKVTGGCTNPVSQEYGKLKPFCKEHEFESPYPKELITQYGGPGLPGAPDPTKDAREVARRMEEFTARSIEQGDDVRVKRGRYRKYGVGTVAEVDPSMEDRTHFVVFPSGDRELKVWLDPKNLDLVE